jgi:pimeloyl-ACP methyl ester carboxylesterase
MNWLLLRGLAREQRHWGRFPALLGAQLPGDRVFCIDLPGTGTEHRRKSPASIAAITADTRARFLALQAQHPGPWRLLGVSLGGMVAMHWCATWPGDFAAVVLINTSAADVSVPWRRMRLAVLPHVVRALVSRDEVARSLRVLRITARLVADPEPVAREWARIQVDAPVSRANILRQLFAASRFRAPKHLTPQVLVIAAAADPLCDPDCPRRLSGRFHAPLLTHPKAGHDLALDDPEWLAGQVGTWVQAAAQVAPAA